MESLKKCVLHTFFQNSIPLGMIYRDLNLLNKQVQKSFIHFLAIVVQHKGK